MEMILQSPYYLVSAVAGFAAVGFIVAAIVFLILDRKEKKKPKSVSENDSSGKSYLTSEKTDKKETTPHLLFFRGKNLQPKESDTEIRTNPEEYKKRIVETYQRCPDLKETVVMLKEIYQGTYDGNIKKAEQYLAKSRYKDYETTLDYLLEGIESENLKQDLLQMEIVKHRRIEVKM